MAIPTYHLKVVTPQGIALEEDVIHSEVPDENGFMGVLAHHAPLVASSPGGRLSVRLKNGREKRYSAGAGFFEITQNHAIFLTQSLKEMS